MPSTSITAGDAGHLADHEALHEAVPVGGAAPVRNGASWSQSFMERVKKDEEDLDVLILSDSTGLINTPWTTQLWTLFGAEWPEKTITARTWADGSGWGASSTIQTGTGSRTIAVNNLSVGGVTTSYPQGGNWGAGVADIDPDLVFISYGHNLTGNSSAVFRGRLVGLVEQVKLSCSRACIALIAQNPQTTNTTMARIAGEVAMTAQLCGVGFIDIHELFLANDDYASEYMADSVHPNATGGAVWAAEVLEHLSWSETQQPLPRSPSSLASVASNAGLVNGDFFDFDGTNVPTGWTGAGTLAYSKNTTNYESPNGWSVKLTATSTGSNIRQDLTINRWKGRWATLGVRVYVPSGQSQSVGRVSLEDAASNSVVSASDGAGTDGWRWIVQPFYCNSTATRLRVRVYATDGSVSTGNISVDRVSVSEGFLPHDIMVRTT